MAVGLVVLLLAGGLGILTQLTHERSFEKLKQAGVIRVGYALEAPYAFWDDEGRLTGESIELARYVVQQLGIVRIDWYQTEFGELIAALEEGRIDVIAAGMFITPERAGRVAFSHPSFHVLQSMLVRKGNPLGIDSYVKAVALEGVKLAALSGSIEEKMLLHLGLASERLLCVPDARTGLDAVSTGLADGLALSSPTVAWMALHDRLGATEMARPFEQVKNGMTGYGAFAFRKSDTSLLRAWNHVMQSYIGSVQHLALIAPFGFTRDEMPGAVSTQEVLAR